MPRISSGAGVGRHVFGRPREGPLQLVERIADANGLVLLLILTTFVITVTLSPEGWLVGVAAVAITGVTAIVALTSSDLRLARVRVAGGAALVAVVAALLARAVSSHALLGAAYIIDPLLLASGPIAILCRVIRAVEVDFRTILGAVSVAIPRVARPRERHACLSDMPIARRISSARHRGFR
jgi:hypothetical protein